LESIAESELKSAPFESINNRAVASTFDVERVGRGINSVIDDDDFDEVWTPDAADVVRRVMGIVLRVIDPGSVSDAPDEISSEAFMG